MSTKPLYTYIFELLDYAERISALIATDEDYNSSYFMTLVYVEDILDKYGRSLVVESIRDGGGSDDEASAQLKEANRRMDALRQQIRKFSQQYDFDEALKFSGQELYKNWHKLPADHQNIVAMEATNE